MRRAPLVLLLVLVLAGIASAATQFTRILNLQVAGKTLLGTTTETGNAITKALGTSATIDFASTSVGSVLSSAITVTGAAAGDTCVVGVPAAAAALSAEFTCYVTAANEVKVKFTPLSHQRGTQALSSGTPSTGTVANITASSTCSCAPVGATAAIAAGGCATGLSGTTLTLTGPDTVTTTMVYDCTAAVDPASGTYYVRVFSAQ